MQNIPFQNCIVLNSGLEVFYNETTTIYQLQNILQGIQPSKTKNPMYGRLGKK